MLESLFNKVAGLQAQQVFSCEYCEIFKDTYFEEHVHMAASNEYEKGYLMFSVEKDLQVCCNQELHPATYFPV